VKIRHKDVIFDKNQRPKPRTKRIVSLMKSNSIYVFGTSIYRHISLRKPENPTRRPEPENIKT